MDLTNPVSGRVVEAILFDLDGTLVDTMPLHYEAYRAVLADLGVSLSFEDFLRASGGPARDTIPRLLGGADCALSVDEIHRRKVALAEEIFARSPPAALPCALLLPILSRAYPVGLVSSGSRRSVGITLDAMGWGSLFRVVVSGNDVEKGKPHPEGYLKGARAIGVSAAACLVFEDSDDGVHAAEAAGMQVFDVRRALPLWRSGGVA